MSGISQREDPDDPPSPCPSLANYSCSQTAECRVQAETHEKRQRIEAAASSSQPARPSRPAARRPALAARRASCKAKPSKV
eukprot:COSAG01_NODE_1870_length_9013_cov_4.865268_4_plen_81_part_00